MDRFGIVAAALAGAVALAGCAGDSAASPSGSSVVPTDLPACEDVYVEGAVIDNENFGLACTRGDELLSPRPVRLECKDGRELLFNELAWGYFGEGMHITPEDDPSKVPEAEVDECLGIT